MALETLKGVTEIGEFKTLETTSIPEVGTVYSPVVIDHGANILSFKIQNGPIKENGVNGCQVDTVIEAAKIILEGLNKQFPCRENSLAITKLDEAILWLGKRKADREKRGVEGTNQK